MKIRNWFHIVFFIACMSVFFNSCKEEKKTYRIGVSQCSRDDWRNKMNEEIEREILVHPEATVEIRSADDSNEKQIAYIRYFADNGFDIIIVAPNEADAITPAIESVYNSGIPVVVFDRNVNGHCYTAFQGADNIKVGESAARYASNLLHGNGKVIELYGLKGSTPAVNRHEGFQREIDRHPGIIISAIAYGNWNYEDALRLTDSMLKTHPDVDLIYAHNDRMAIAASDAARAKGIDPYIIGIDAAPEIGMKAVRDSVIDATFLYPTEGHRLIRTALAILKGEPYDSIASLPIPSAVDLGNADILLIQNESLKEETSKMKSLKSQIDRYWDKHSAQTTLFYVSIAFVILLCVLLFLILRAFWQRRSYQETLLRKNEQLARQHDQQKELNEQLELATQSKLAFFTNVSHDLRTPLTLIAEPVEQLATADNLSPSQRTLIKIAEKNVRILKRLINQILDFRTYENGKLSVKLTEVDFGMLAAEWIDAFKGVARKRDIKLNVEIPAERDFKIALDVEKMERVFYNLMSNALKYTPPNGMVAFSCDCDGSQLHFSIKDNGVGIEKEDQKRIFDRFFQVDKVNPKGSGIGLSLVKAFVELHGGEISLDSEIGKGSEFVVTIPVTHVDEQMKGCLPEIDKDEIESELGDINYEKGDFKEDKPLILVVDDNEDIRSMLKELLSAEYNVAAVTNGKEGVRFAARYVPDIVVCDVMMPVMDGFECCRLIKNEVSTSHIPVLLLTACSMDEQRVEGYQNGADGYLSKPFNIAVLNARIKGMIENRKRIKNLWGGESGNEGDLAKPVSLPKEQRNVPGDMENEFYSRFLRIVESRMGNVDLNVDELASEMGLGRSQFYRKIKALTNYSPVELIRNLRLKRARHLLSTTDRSISEIAYEVGFSTPAYFSKCYREAFGETPSDLRSRL